MEIDHELTDEMVCPHCGYEEGDSWEHMQDSGVAQCGECDRDYSYERDVTVYYTTKKTEAPDENHTK